MTLVKAGRYLILKELSLGPGLAQGKNDTLVGTYQGEKSNDLIIIKHSMQTLPLLLGPGFSEY